MTCASCLGTGRIVRLDEYGPYEFQCPNGCCARCRGQHGGPCNPKESAGRLPPTTYCENYCVGEDDGHHPACPTRDVAHDSACERRAGFHQCACGDRRKQEVDHRG